MTKTQYSIPRSEFLRNGSKKICVNKYSVSVVSHMLVLHHPFIKNLNYSWKYPGTELNFLRRNQLGLGR